MLGIPLRRALYASFKSAARCPRRLGAEPGATQQVTIMTALGAGKEAKGTNVSSTPTCPWHKNLAPLPWEHARAGTEAVL